MKKITDLSVNSLTHCSTSVFEVEKGDKFYSLISNIQGAMRFYEVTLKRGKNEFSVWLYRAKDKLIIINDDDDGVNDDDGIWPGALFYRYGRPVFIWPRLILPVMGREMNQEENYMESNDTVELMNSSNWEDRGGKPPMVEHPPHYISGKYECIDVMKDVFGNEAVENFCLLNAFKYLYRCTYEDSYKDDLKKAKRNIEMILENY